MIVSPAEPLYVIKAGSVSAPSPDTLDALLSQEFTIQSLLLDLYRSMRPSIYESGTSLICGA